MLVERIETTAQAVRVHGRFDRLDGVCESGKFRLRRGEYIWADLMIDDRSAGTVVVTNAIDPDVAKLRLGERYTWFHDHWDAPLVEAIADDTTSWQQFEFKATDAQYFRLAGSIGWQPTGTPLSEGAVPLEVKPGGWDHEHCDLCGTHIDTRNPLGYTDAEGHFLCSPCYDSYGANHDLSFQLGD